MRKLVEWIIPLAVVLGLTWPAAFAQDAPPPGAGDTSEATDADATRDESAPDEIAPADPANADAAAETQPAESDVAAGMIAAGNALLGERLVDMAQTTVRQSPLDNSAFHRAAALLRAATRLEARDGRAWRLLVDTELQLGNMDGALEALQGYRALAPGDSVAQIQVIEIYANRIEAGEKALDYLRGLVDRESLPPDVRSHVAMMTARRLLERGETQAAREAVEHAIELNSVNVAALDLKYQLLPADAGPQTRAEALLAILKANPVRPAVLGELGRLLAGVGLSKDSVDWTKRALELYARSQAIDPQAQHDLFIDYAAQLYIGGQIQAARTGVDQMLKALPNDIDAWLLKLVIDRGTGDKDAYAKSLEGAAAALQQRWAEVAHYVADEAPDAAGPSSADAPEPAAVAEQVRAAQDSRKAAAFVTAASDYAWFEIYFNEQPDAAGKWIDAIETVAAEDSVTLRRLRGWAQLAGKQPDEARQTLDPIRATDPLAALAALRLAGDEADKAARKANDDEARNLLERNPSGLVGAILAQALKDRALKPEPHPEAAAIRSELQKFPRGWLDLAEQPQRFYSIRIEPLRIAHRYGEAMYIKVSLKNVGDQPIPIGDDGVIRPGLWFDAEAQAMAAQGFSGIAIERLGQSTVLPAGGSIAQYVRFDQGNLAAALNSSPTPRVQVTGWCSTNVVRQGNGYGPGPAGVRVPFSRKMTRVGFPIGKKDVLEKAYVELEQGLPDMKVRNLSLLAAYVAQINAGKRAAQEPGGPEQDPAALEQQRQAAAGAARLGGEMRDRIAAATRDEVPAVAQWAKFMLARVSEGEPRRQVIDSLLEDPRWESRLLGVIGARNLDPEQARERIGKIAESADEDPLVKSYAGEVLEVLNRPPPPATQPASAEGDKGAAP